MLWSRLSVVLLVVVAFVAAALSSLRGGLFIPPTFHDQTANVFGAKTFLAGRLANPTPDLAEHFEAPHILIQPTWSSKYPPGVALALAGGQLLGHFLVASWLAVALWTWLCYRILRFFVGHCWALLGGIQALLTALSLNWGFSYGFFGEFFAVSGAALVWGVLIALRHPSIASAVWTGIGLGGLALIRPFEGLFFAFATLLGALLAIWPSLSRRSVSGIYGDWMKWASWSLVWPLLAIVFTLLYNFSVSGHPLHFPHLLHTENYLPAVRHFTFENRDASALPDSEHRFFHELQAHFAQSQHGPSARTWWEQPGLLARAVTRDFVWILFPWSIELVAVSLLALAFGQHRFPRRYLLLWCDLGIWPIVFLLSEFREPRYLTAWIVPGLTLAVICASTIWARLGRPFRFRSGVLAHVCVAILLLWPSLEQLRSQSWQNSLGGRQVIEQQLLSGGRPFLILVRRMPQSSVHIDWIQNEPKLEASPVIWARSISPERDNALAARYGSNRQILYLLVRDSEYAAVSASDFYAQP